MATSAILACPTSLPPPAPSRKPYPLLQPHFLTNRRRHLPVPLRSKPFGGHLPLPLPLIAARRPSPISSSLSAFPFRSIPDIPLPSIADVTPLAVCKWAAAAAVAVTAMKMVAGALFSPFFWMYFSWTWIYWPWLVAAGIGIYGLFCLWKYLMGESSVFEQVSVVTATITWLTLVPPAHFNGFLEGWPVAFFFVYHYFFFFESSVRKRLYGDLHSRPHDPKWDVKLPRVVNVVFSVLVLVAHWLAAMEGLELHLVPGGWSNVWIWGLIMMVLFMRYHSVLYLAKYSEKVVVPTAVVQFGPYRWVRHPIYSSTILLFATYCIALRSPLSLVFITMISLLYYGQKAVLEEDLMMDTFGKRYAEYMGKVKYRLIPFVY